MGRRESGLSVWGWGVGCFIIDNMQQVGTEAVPCMQSMALHPQECNGAGADKCRWEHWQAERSIDFF